MVYIFFIYAADCKHCQEVLDNLENAMSNCEKIACKINKLHYDSKEAINLAINRGIDDLPGVVIGDSVFIKSCSEKEAIEAIKKAAKN